MKRNLTTNVFPAAGRRLSFLRRTAAGCFLVFLCCAVLPVKILASEQSGHGNRTAEDDDPALTILCSSDLHGTVFGESEDRASMLKMASVIRRVRHQEKARGREILLLDCGDLICGSFEASLNPPDRIADFLNLMAYDAIVPGNHDAEYGMKTYLDFCRRFRGQVLCANLQDPAGKNWKTAWTLVRKNDLNIALIGCTAPYLDQWLTQGQLESWQAGSLIPALEKIIHQVMAAQPDCIILMLHLGEFVPERLLLSDNPDDRTKERSLYALSKRFPQIQLILGGHSHIAEAGKRLYPLTWFAQAPAHARGIVQIKLYRHAAKRSWQIRSEILSVKEEQTDREAENLFAEWRECTDREKQRLLAVFPKRVFSLQLLDQAVKSKYPDTVFALFPKPAYKWFKKEITPWDLYKTYPYENRLCFLYLNREQFLQLIKDQKNLKNEDYILTASGKELTADLFQPDRSGKMKVAVSSYAAAGGGGRYPVLRKLTGDPACRFQESTMKIRDLLQEYLLRRSSRKNNPAAAEK